MSQRLELVWPNKDKVLLGLDENGKPIWGTKADLEARRLVQLDAVGETSPDNPNDLCEQGDSLLIKGDNLLALKALERHFAGKIKCIYIDPPFNTGNAFEHYDDGLEHTIWLSMMKARLEILRKLLREGGAIFVEIDDSEMPYLRVLMDEIFGRNNFRNYFCARRTDKNVSTQFLRKEGSRLRSFQKEFEFCLCYAKADATLLAPLYRETSGRRKEGYWKAFYNNADRPTMRYEILGARIDEGQWKWSYERAMKAVENYNNYEKDFAPKMTLKDYWETTGRNLGFIRRNPRSRGKHKGVEHWVAPSETALAGNNWTDLLAFANDGYFQTGKNERYIARVIEISTSPGDWVLDSFLGSGTTAAVAHKLGRKWIGIELGEHAETLCLPRLKRVVSGEDQTGISKQVGWKGGGGFRYCVLGESLFAKDEDTGLVMINPKYTNGPLVAALCNLEDFNLNDDSLFQGVRGNTYAHITEDKVTQAYLDALTEKLPQGKNLAVYCLKRAAGLGAPPEVKVKRIPKELQIPRYLTNGDRGSRG